MKLLTAGALLIAAGCSTNTAPVIVTHTFASDLALEVAAGTCAPVVGPRAIPGGASTDYTVLDDNGDADTMNIAVIDDAFGCDFNNGFAVSESVSSVSAGESSIPPGNYDLVVHCDNLVLPCDFTLTWTADF
jgi:hypothetical protein